MRLQTLVQAGEVSEEEASRLIEKLLGPSAVRIDDSKLNQDIEAFFARNRLPTRDDLHRLTDQLDDLSKKLAEITDKDQ